MKSIFKNIMLFLLIAIVVILIVTTCSSIGYNCYVQYKSDEIKTNAIHSYNIDNNVFYSKDIEIEDLEQIKTTVNESMSLLPDYIRNLFTSKWTIYVSWKAPFNVTNNPNGATNYNTRCIWILPNSSSRVLLHEIGHALDNELGLKSYSSEWVSLYNQYSASYIEKEEYISDSYSMSSTTEFFAAMVAEYYRNPEHLKENAPDIYNYLDKQLNNKINYVKIVSFGYSYVKIFKIITNAVRLPKFGPTAQYMMKQINSNIQNKPFIDINEYHERQTYDWMSNDGKYVIETMLDLIKHPDNYPVTVTAGSMIADGYILEFDYPWSFSQYEELLSFTALYFGDEFIDPIDVNVVNQKTTRVILNKEVILKAEAVRLESLKKVEETLSTFKQGIEQEIMIQAAYYIVSNSKYKLEDYSKFDSFWEKTKGDCVMYTMIFHQFATRIGVKSEVVHISNNLGEGHVYNKLTFTDGSVYYYDLSENIVQSGQLDKTNFVLNRWVSYQ